MIGRTALVRTTQRVATRRAQSSGASPKMHRAKDAWSELEATRAPKDHDDLHLVFHPPYNFAVTTTMILTCAVTGWGLMFFGAAWQQKKQGFWK